jgi:hypothetical protein
LRDAQQKILVATLKWRRCAVSSRRKSPEACARLQPAVQLFNGSQDGFESKTYCGEFVYTVADTQAFIGIALR